MTGPVRLAIIANAPAPYRLAQHTRIVRELPGVRLFTIFKHEHNNSPWKNPLPPEINPIVFGKGELMTQKNRGANTLRQWGRGGEVVRFLREQSIQAVIVTGYNDLGLLRIIDWCHGKRVPVFMFNDSNKYGDRATGPAKVFKKAFVPWVLRRLTGLMPCGIRGVEYYAPYASGRSVPAFYMPHEPNYAAINAVTPQRVAEARAKHGLRPDLRYISYCARMTGVKRPGLLVDAFARIAADRPGWGVVFVGGGDLLEATRAQVPESLRDRVVFTGFVDGSDNVAALYKCCELHVLPSGYEPWAAVIPEAGFAGLALIASHVVGAAAECIKEGVNGYTFTSGDADDLAEKLRLATDTGAIERLRAGTAEVMRDWRLRCDPVDGVRRALEFAGLLVPASGTKPTGNPLEDWKPDAAAGVSAILKAAATEAAH